MADPGNDPVSTNDPANPPAAADPEPPAAAEPKSFTEDDVNRIVQDRLSRQKAQFADYADLKAKAEKFDEIEQQSKSDLEKANERAAELEAQLTEVSTAHKDSLLRVAVVSEAAKRNVVDPDAALALLDRSQLEFGDDGAPTNIADAMDSLLTAKPYLVSGGQTRGSADLGARGTQGPQISRDDLKNMTSKEIVDAQNSGHLEHLTGPKP